MNGGFQFKKKKNGGSTNNSMRPKQRKWSNLDFFFRKWFYTRFFSKWFLQKKSKYLIFTLHIKVVKRFIKPFAMIINKRNITTLQAQISTHHTNVKWNSFITYIIPYLSYTSIHISINIYIHITFKWRIMLQNILAYYISYTIPHI